MTYEFLFAAREGGGVVPTTLTAVRRMVERGHRVRVLGDNTLRGEVISVGAQHVPWRRAPNRGDRSMNSDPVRDWENEGPGGTLLVLLDRTTIGQASAYALDTAEELRRRPADVVVSSDLLFGPMIGAEAVGTKLAILSSNIAFFTPIPGIPPAGPELLPAVMGADHAQVAAARNFLSGVMAGT
jgi:hypothetical protein